MGSIVLLRLVILHILPELDKGVAINTLPSVNYRQFQLAGTSFNSVIGLSVRTDAVFWHNLFKRERLC